jgi:hypothetical protein
MSGTKLEVYSQLASLLNNRRVAVPELKRQMQRLGLPVNIKSLYRLTSAEPLQKIDLRIVSAICRTCKVGISEVIDFTPPKLTMQQLDSSAQKRLNELMSKNTEGSLTAAERGEFENLAKEAQQITITNARILASHRRKAGPGRPPSRRKVSIRRRRKI